MVVLLGRVSYATYILQGPIARGFALATGRALAQLGPWELLVYVLLLLGISVVIYFNFELPLERWIKRRFNGESRAIQREPAWDGSGRADHL